MGRIGAFPFRPGNCGKVDVAGSFKFPAVGAQKPQVGRVKPYFNNISFSCEHAVLTFPFFPGDMPAHG
jgi:hypothetical protein